MQFGMSPRDFFKYSAFLAAKWTVFEGDGCIFLELVDLGGIVRWLMILLFHDAPFTYYCQNSLIHNRNRGPEVAQIAESRF